MGKTDSTSKFFYSKPKNFLSIVKLFYSDGRLTEKNLQEISENLLVMIDQLMEGKGKQKKKKILERYRDTVKMIQLGKERIIVGIENQRYMDCSEPVRVMLYDVMEYERQRKFIQWAHEEKRDLRGDEFVAGFSRKDRLVPVTTIVIYYGKEPWKSPKKLSDIQKKGNGRLGAFEELMQDYGINVIDVRRLTDEQIEGIGSEVKLLFGYVKNDGNPVKLQKFIQKSRKEFERLSKETYEMIAVMTETGKLLEIMKDVEVTGGYNMCRAIDEMVKAGEKRGMEQGIEQGRQQGMEQGRQQGLEQGIQQGMEQGIQQGESQLGLLISRLFADGRTNDAQKAAADERIRKEFYREYGIAQ
ncbi:MAG: Rpn family recombination-promoting nuclease/putative transposase [Thermoflexaceae bacterium]|nr:Rpn family recombination-promoting nuclease/putative transposase [Thermoflexaceae bacterium]